VPGVNNTGKKLSKACGNNPEHKKSTFGARCKCIYKLMFSTLVYFFPNLYPIKSRGLASSFNHSWH
jgi:hypothetical protein